MIELPGSEGDKNIPLIIRMAHIPTKNEYVRMTFWDVPAFCIKTPVCPVPHFSMGMDGKELFRFSV
jgi:hypothetical protein